MRSHPDRRARTLAQCPDPPPEPGSYDPPGEGSADARIDLKLLVWRARRAMASPAGEPARQRLARWAAERHPDLWAGTVQDGTARGFMVALEEAISLVPVAAEPEPEEDPLRVAEFVQPALRRKKDILVASGGARMRYSRKGGLLFVDRAHEVHSEDCLRFEDRRDTGDLDRFETPIDERPRLFQPAFLKPVLLRQGPLRDLLVLEGRLGRGPRGYPCRLTLEGRKDETFLRLRVTVDNRHPDHRLRLRFLGLPPPPYLRHHCTDTWEQVVNDAGGFCAATIVRACGHLRVDDDTVPVPAAQCPGAIEHVFELGAAPDRAGGSDQEGRQYSSPSRSQIQ